MATQNSLRLGAIKKLRSRVRTGDNVSKLESEYDKILRGRPTAEVANAAAAAVGKTTSSVGAETLPKSNLKDQRLGQKGPLTTLKSGVKINDAFATPAQRGKSIRNQSASALAAQRINARGNADQTGKAGYTELVKRIRNRRKGRTYTGYTGPASGGPR